MQKHPNAIMSVLAGYVVTILGYGVHVIYDHFHWPLPPPEVSIAAAGLAIAAVLWAGNKTADKKVPGNQPPVT